MNYDLLIRCVSHLEMRARLSYKQTLGDWRLPSDYFQQEKLGDRLVMTISRM